MKTVMNQSHDGWLLKMISRTDPVIPRGWAMALLLSEINPAAQDEILKKGYEWGESRVIAGYHWQSDTDASRLLASACYARLHTSEDFLEDMAAAREEFAEKLQHQ